MATALLIIGFLGAGLLPLVGNWGDVAKIFLWYYIDAASPLINGPDWAQLACSRRSGRSCSSGRGGFARRDLLTGAATGSLADRLRENPASPS